MRNIDFELVSERRRSLHSDNKRVSKLRIFKIEKTQKEICFSDRPFRINMN